MFRLAIPIAALWLLPLPAPAQAPALPPSARPAEASAQELELVKELSLARTRPKEYARYLKALRPCFKGTLWSLPDRVPLRTEEGVAALDEAIAFLEAATPCGPLRWSRGLSRAARSHVADQGPTGATGHRSSDGKGLRERILKHGLHLSLFGEVINYGEEDARMHVIELLIDDGVPGRGHRINIFNPDFHRAGVAIGPHKTYGGMAVVVLADGFTED